MKPRFLQLIARSCSTGLTVLWLCYTLFIGTGCGALYYNPPAQRMVNVTQKGEMNVSAVVPMDPLGINGINMQAAYSPVKYLGITASYLYIDKRRIEYFSFGESRRVTNVISNGDVSVGGYYPWTLISLDEDFAIRLIPELYLGTGRGSARNIYRTRQDFSMLHYNRHFVQAGLQLKIGHYVSLLAAHQWVNLDYRRALSSGDLPATVPIDIDNIQSRNPFSFTETSLGMAVGYKGIKLNSSITFASPGLDGQVSSLQQNFFFMGITLEIAEILKY